MVSAYVSGERLIEGAGPSYSQCGFLYLTQVLQGLPLSHFVLRRLQKVQTDECLRRRWGMAKDKTCRWWSEEELVEQESPR